ncbi:MAG: type II toxin-antitoxin system VapC family toxin [Limisphaerales bacterium]
MIAVDTNILVYSHREESPFHANAKQLIGKLRESSAEWAVPWPCIHEFIAIVTNPRIFKVPTPLDAAFACIDAWLAGDNLQLIAESDGYLMRLRELSSKAKLQGARIHDARIASLCLHHGINELWTADRDFSAFPQLPTRNPLIST